MSEPVLILPPNLQNVVFEESSEMPAGYEELYLLSRYFKYTEKQNFAMSVHQEGDDKCVLVSAWNLCWQNALIFFRSFCWYLLSRFFFVPYHICTSYLVILYQVLFLCLWFSHCLTTWWVSLVASITEMHFLCMWPSYTLATDCVYPEQKTLFFPCSPLHFCMWLSTTWPCLELQNAQRDHPCLGLGQQYSHLWPFMAQKHLSQLL